MRAVFCWGGAVEVREALADAAARELREETGLHGRAQGVNFFFLGREWAGQPEPLDNTSEMGWFDPHDLPADSLPWLGQALKNHLQGGQFFAEQVD